MTTIRFYEERGLLPAPPRSDGGQRLYGAQDIARLRFIRHARDLGFGMAALADLLELAGHPQAPCADADRLAVTVGAIAIVRYQRYRSERVFALNDAATRSLRRTLARQRM